MEKTDLKKQKAYNRQMAQQIERRKAGTLKQRFVREIQKNWILYLMLVPVIVYFVIFKYYPMYGIQLAFKDYKTKLGITGSPWVGLKHFKRFFGAYDFWRLMKNTLTLTLYQLACFPIAIIFAVLLNYLKNLRLKKVVQSASYAPHFISTVVLCGMISLILAPHGIVNTLLQKMGMESVNFLEKPEAFKHVYTWSTVWQDVGWNAIIYISALAGVDSQLHDAAIIDGANIFQRIWHVDLPAIRPTIIMLLVLSIGGMMNVGFEKVFLLQNNLNITAADTISTYVYRMGMVNRDFGFSSAVGLFNTIINVILVVTANFLSKKLTDESVF